MPKTQQALAMPCAGARYPVLRILKGLGKAALACALSLPVLLCGIHTPSANAAATMEPFWSSGKTQIFAIQDRPGEMAMELFSGPASPEERAGFFENGKTPASINAFLMRIGGKNILIDTGFGTIAPGGGALLPSLDALGIPAESIDIVLLTHMHMDHAGGLLINKKRAFPKANIMVAKAELDYWLALAEKEPGNANAALVKTVTEEYGSDILPPFAYGDGILPGVTPLDASGHTPGHTAFLIESEGKKLLVVGDLIHAAALQLPLPEECARYDIDPVKAVASRIKILDLAAGENIPVAGMHIPFPGYGSIEKQGKGYRLTPGSEKN